MNQLQERPQSPANTRICKECKQKKTLFNNSDHCVGCYGLTMLSKVAWPNGSMVWNTCKLCGIEWSKLYGNGSCIDCENKRIDEFHKKKRNEERLIKIFGSIKTANCFTFSNFKVLDGNETAYKKCRNFDPAKDNIYMWGSCGTGKTHLAYATAKTHFLHGRKVIITSPMKMVDTFRTKNDLEKEDKMDEYTSCDILLIDDLGISKYTDFAIEIICELLNRRTLQMRNGLIITSNLSLDQMAQKNKDDRVTSRIAGLCLVTNVHGPDFRSTRITI